MPGALRTPAAEQIQGRAPCMVRGSGGSHLKVTGRMYLLYSAAFA